MIIALDPSLTATGLAVLGPSQVNPYWAVRTFTSTAQSNELGNLRRMERLVAQMRRAVQELTLGTHLALGVIEAPAYSRNTGMSHERAGLWWMVFQMMVGHGMPVLVIKSNVRAKYATGKGNAGKDEVMLAASRRYPTVPMANNNEADAVVLAAMGARYLGVPVDTLPQKNLEAMVTVTG